MLLAIAFLFVFLFVASVDGFYFHLYKYRLYARREAQYEHLLHTVTASLLVPQVVLSFCVRPTGAWLYLTAALALVIFSVEILDVLCEGDARARIGGLTPVESAMHFAIASARAGFLVAYFNAVGVEAWSAPTGLGAVPGWQLAFGFAVLLPAVVVALFHVVLAVQGRRAPLVTMAP